MKISEVTIEDVMRYLRYDEDADCDIKKDIETIIMAGAKAYMISLLQTGDEFVWDDHEDLTVAYLMMCAILDGNRSATEKEVKENPAVRSILGRYRNNLI